MADRILPVGNGGVLGSSKSMSKMRVNPYRDRAKSFYQRYVIRDFSHDELVTRLGSMKESQLSESHERLIQTADWLANIIRALEDTNDARSSTNQDTATDVRH